MFKTQRHSMKYGLKMVEGILTMVSDNPQLRVASITCGRSSSTKLRGFLRSNSKKKRGNSSHPNPGIWSAQFIPGKSHVFFVPSFGLVSPWWTQPHKLGITWNKTREKTTTSTYPISSNVLTHDSFMIFQYMINSILYPIGIDYSKKDQPDWLTTRRPC